jgi:transposase-like protein
MANRYSNEGRQEAVKLAREIGSKTASERLGSNPDMLYTWISKDKKHGEPAFVGSGNKHVENHAVEIERLQKELNMSAALDSCVAQIRLFRNYPYILIWQTVP